LGQGIPKSDRLYLDRHNGKNGDPTVSVITSDTGGKQREVVYKIRWDWSAKGQT
jgi:hypothetical protein